jgi:hypothetical protein
MEINKYKKKVKTLKKIIQLILIILVNRDFTRIEESTTK